ncbi:patatin-like protein [Erythrobacteraceae bacterium E2-1 Yellow Sea]|nr:patatin-like protein [Erythrobacteraceae bacterium E2-1 Yellow Sea]
MRQKELRIALVCYGGVSLAVYMHGVTKELWQLTRASRASTAGETIQGGTQQVYWDLLECLKDKHDMRLRVLSDILTGASAGGINAIFLAQAIHSGQSLDPLTDLWLENADVERLVDPDARPMWRFAKFWAQPFVEWVLRRSGNVVSESVAPETRDEVRHKVSRFMRGRWFQPPFSGDNFSGLLFDAFEAMRTSDASPPLLPPGHPIDLNVTATDFRGHLEMLRLNSPAVVKESEHRLPISFAGQTPREGGVDIADPIELTFAARATASFPGAFPALRLNEIDRLAERRNREWSGRRAFLHRTMPVHLREQAAEYVSLIDGSVLVNKPFGSAIASLQGRPAQREVDRRFVYIDPRPDRFATLGDEFQKEVGFFEAIFGSVSIIPREQPIRDNLEALDKQSRDAARINRIVHGLRPDVERAVEKLFGLTLFLDRPTTKRLKSWRNKAQQAAAEDAGYAFHSYAQAKFGGIIERLASLAFHAAPQLGLHDAGDIELALREELERRGLDTLSSPKGGASDDAIQFFRAHDISFRIRRLRLLARRLARDWEVDPEVPDDALDLARDRIYSILSLYFERDHPDSLGPDFAGVAANVLTEPGILLDYLEGHRLLEEVDERAEQLFAEALDEVPKSLRRRMLLTYLGFPFYDVATLPLLHNEGLTEYNSVKVDRISPDDARSIREGGTHATLRGIEFYNFGAFFSRSYRENDYLWGRLHGAERMIDLICSTLDHPIAVEDCTGFKRAAFMAILEEELEAGRLKPDLIEMIRAEVIERMG